MARWSEGVLAHYASQTSDPIRKAPPFKPVPGAPVRHMFIPKELWQLCDYLYT